MQSEATKARHAKSDGTREALHPPPVTNLIDVFAIKHITIMTMILLSSNIHISINVISYMASINNSRDKKNRFLLL